MNIPPIKNALENIMEACERNLSHLYPAGIPTEIRTRYEQELSFLKISGHTDDFEIYRHLSEEATKRIASKQRPNGLGENIKVARMGGHAAKVAREDIEKNLGESVITKDNRLNYKYIEIKQLKSEN